MLQSLVATPLAARGLVANGPECRRRLRIDDDPGWHPLADGDWRQRHDDARARGGIRERESAAVLLIHGFPELAYSWRKVMLPLAKAGYHVIAPDQRGYGKNGGTDVKFDDDLTPFTTLNECAT